MTMILALVLAQAAAPAATAAPTPEVAEEMAAIRGKLSDWNGGVYKHDGKLLCRTETSSGDRAVDAIRCGAMVACIEPLQEEMDAIAASALSEAERNRKLELTAKSAMPCVERVQSMAIEKLARDRVAG